MNVINSTARQMNELAKANLAQLGREPKCVHRSLLLRSLILLKEVRPESEDFFSPVFRTLIVSSKRPDRKNDYEKGMGRHYYCAVKPSGKAQNKVNSYYPSGTGSYSNSSRVLFEENYTMALTFYCAGCTEQWADQLGRAIHMISDMCCLPHTAAMTYFSTASKFHKAYELFAESIYPDNVPMQVSPEIPHIFTDHSSFADDLNLIAEETAAGLAEIETSPYDALCRHLWRTENIICALLIRFMDDTLSADRASHYIAGNSGCRLLKGTQPLTAKVIPEGISFHGVNPSPESKINVTDTLFYAAHRHDGLFTLSPVRDKNGRVLEVNGGKFVWKKFDPVHGEQLFRL